MNYDVGEADILADLLEAAIEDNLAPVVYAAVYRTAKKKSLLAHIPLWLLEKKNIPNFKRVSHYLALTPRKLLEELLIETRHRTGKERFSLRAALAHFKTAYPALKNYHG